MEADDAANGAAVPRRRVRHLLQPQLVGMFVSLSRSTAHNTWKRSCTTCTRRTCWLTHSTDNELLGKLTSTSASTKLALLNRHALHCVQVWGQKSSGAVPFGTLFALCFLWFGISVPLVFIGSYFGYKKPAPEVPPAVLACRHIGLLHVWHSGVRESAKRRDQLPGSTCVPG